MRKIFSRHLAIAASLMFLGACDQLSGQSQHGGIKVTNPVAVVNGYKVAPEILDIYSEARTRQKFEALSQQQKQEVLDEAIKLIAISTEARSRKLHKEPEIAARIELQSMNVLAQARIGKLVEEAEIDDARLQAAYEAQYVTSPKKEYKARHILVKTEEEARGIISELEGGADFAKLAEEKSIGPSAGNGGDLGWFARDAMVKPFADAVATMEAGQFSKSPVQTQFGYHVILAEGSRESAPPDFESVRESLRSSVQQDIVEEFIENTSNAADIRILIDLQPESAAEADAEAAANSGG